MSAKTDSGSAEKKAVRSVWAAAAPFLPPWLVAAIPVPTVGALLHYFGGGDPLWTPFLGIGLTAVTAVLAFVAYNLGAKRTPLVQWHATITVAAAGMYEVVTMIAGFPVVMRWVLAIGGIGFAGSWNLYRINALRQDSKGEGSEDGKLKEALGLAKTAVGKPRISGARVEIPLRHRGGGTVKDAQSAISAIEAEAGVLPGRSRVVPDPNDASRSLLVLIAEDVLKQAIPWEGPTAVDGSIEEPIVSGRYEDDLPAQYWLPGRAPNPAKGIAGRAPSNVMRMGMSRAGKTMDALITTADLSARIDVAIIWADLVKGEQTSGAVEPAFTVYAQEPARAKRLVKRLKTVVKDRADALGKAGYAEWNAAAFRDPRLRMPFLLVHLEEASDIIADSDNYTWLTRTALSAGVCISVSLQRADGESQPTSARYNIGIRQCFGTGDSYSAAFALSEETLDAGAAPDKWKATKQGYYYLEAPEVPEDRWPVPARGFYAPPAEIRRVVDHYAPGMADLDPITLNALGTDFAQEALARQAARKSGQPYVPTATAASPTPMEDDVNDDDTEDLEIPAAPTEPELATEVDPRQPVPAHAGQGVDFGGRRATQAEAEAAFDALLVQMANEGVEEFQLDELFRRLQVRSKPWIRGRLKAMLAGDLVLPEGIGLSQDEDVTGRYHIERSAPVVALSGAGSSA